MAKWTPNPKVSVAGVLGPVIMALVAALSTDPFDWKLPLSALLTAVIAYLTPPTLKPVKGEVAE